VIRPPRDLYSPDELGPLKFRLGRRVYERRDLQLKSCRGVLECSHFVPSRYPEARRPCVVYLHGNCSSRLEAFDALPVLLPRDMTVFCLDLSGSGRSEGEYISLGYHEEKDLQTVLNHLRSLKSVASIGLWGRSMGATTSILCAAKDHNLAACVLDSAFRDLRTVAEELVNRGRFKVPSFLVNMALEMIRTEVMSRASFDPTELMPINCAPTAVCPAFFGVASDDTFVLPHHTQDLHNAWGGERVLRVFDGGHNGVRPAWFLEEAADFLVDRLKPSRDQASAGTQDVISTSSFVVASENDSSDDDYGNPEERRTPRLLSPILDKHSTDADAAAGKAAKNGIKPDADAKKTCAMAVELSKMGFGASAVARACHHCSNLEDAVEWLLKQPGEVFCNVEARPPAGQRDLGPGGGFSCPDGDDPLVQSPVPGCGSQLSKASSGKKPDAGAKRVLPPGATIAEHLHFLGFSERECVEASRRCLTLEAALEYLATQEATVQL